MSIDVSIAHKDDAEAIAKLFHQVSLIHYENLKEEFKEPKFENDLAYIKECLEKEDIRIIKAQADEIICGYLILYVHTFPEEFFVNPKRGFVGSIGVDEQQRGKGVGKSMLIFAENDLKEQGIKVFDIDFYTFNTAAEKLYNSLGFKDIKHYKRKYI